MNYFINIFLIFSLIILTDCSSEYEKNQNIGFKDEMQIEAKHLQTNFKTDDWNVEGGKRKSNGYYMPLYDEFKRRLDSFNAGLLQNNDRQALNNENLYSQFADEIIKMRSNRGFFSGGIKKKEKEQESKKLIQSKKHSGEQKTRLRRRQQIAEHFKTKNKSVVAEVKPGNLYDEYKRQIKKANAAFA